MTEPARSAVATPEVATRPRWESSLESWLDLPRGGIVHFIGVGNGIRQDDAAGLKVVSALRKTVGARPHPNVTIHAPSLNPEMTMVSAASQGDRLLLFDAVATNSPPGSVVFVGLGETKFGFFATHNVPLRVLPHVAERLDSAKVVGIQPELLGIGEEMSARVSAACDHVAARVAMILRGGAVGPN